MKSSSTTIVTIICFAFILLFVYAATSKLADYDKFIVQLRQSPMLTAFAEIIVWLIPMIEIIISILLLFPASALLGLYGSFSLMVTFTFYIITIQNFSEYVPCSCGGILEYLNWNEHLYFNIGFIILAIAGILLETVKARQKYLLQ